MARRQIYIGIAGVLLGVIGLAALWFPVYLDQFDGYGIKIACGNGIIAEFSNTDVADRAAVAARCDTAVLVRRAWAIPTVAIGGLLVATFLMGWVRNAPAPSEDPRMPLTPLPPLPWLPSGRDTALRTRRSPDAAGLSPDSANSRRSHRRPRPPGTRLSG